MSPFTVAFGSWQPDLANVAYQTLQMQIPVTVPLADCLNVRYVNGTYQSLPTAAAVAGFPQLPAPVVGVATLSDAAAQALPMAGVSQASGSTAIYYWSGMAWTPMTINPAQIFIGTIAVSWSFAQLGSQYFGLIFPRQLYFLNGNTAASLYTGSPGTTWNLVAGAPFGTVMGVVGQFLMMGDLFGEVTSILLGTGNGSQTTFSGTLNEVPAFPGSIEITEGGANVAVDNGAGIISGTGVTGTVNYDSGAVSVTFAVPPGLGINIGADSGQAFRARLQWSAIGNGANWPVPLTQNAYALQAGQQDQEYQYGPIMAIVGFPLYGIIFQRNAIARANYIGGNVVFSWGTYSYNLGLIAKGAWVQVGTTVYFLSDQGFFATDGANVTPIGTAPNNSSGIDGWFWANVNKAALSAIRAGYDALSRNIQFAIPTGANTQPDTLLCYNPLAAQWTRGAVASSVIWTDSDGSTDRLGVFDQSNNYSLLTGPPNLGYLESCDIEFADGMPRTTTAARPLVAGTSPTVQLANRNTLTASPTYSAATAPDPFGGGYAGVIGQGLYTRVRVSSANTRSIQGAQLMMQPSGGV